MRNLLIISICVFLGLPHLAHAGVYEDVLAAANNGRTQEVIDLLRRGLDVNTADRDGNTLLAIAARSGNVALAGFLIENRASFRKPNRFGDNPLHAAVSQGHIKVVELLVAGGAEINPAGWTPLHYAIYGNHLDIARLLISRGASLEARAPNGQTALMLAAQIGKVDAAELLLKAGADRFATDYQGAKAAEIAKSKGFDDLARMLAR